MISWSCFKAEVAIGTHSAKIVVLQCSFCALVRAFRSTCESFYFSGLFISSPSLQFYYFVEHILVAGSGYWKEKTFLFASDGDWKKPFASELRQSRDSNSLNGDPPLIIKMLLLIFFFLSLWMERIYHNIFYILQEKDQMICWKLHVVSNAIDFKKRLQMFAIICLVTVGVSPL